MKVFILVGLLGVTAFAASKVEDGDNAVNQEVRRMYEKRAFFSTCTTSKSDDECDMLWIDILRNRAKKH